MSSHARGLITVGAGVLILSPDALLVRALGLGSFTIIFWQGLLNAIGFLALSSVLYGRATPARLAAMGRVGLALAGLSGLNAILFVVALTHTAVANTLVILAASPVFAAALSAVLLGDRIRPETWAACVLVLLGVIAIVAAHPGGADLAGDLAAVAGALSTSVMFIVLRRHRDADPLPGMTVGGLVAACVAFPAAGSLSLDGHELVLLLTLGLLLLPAALGLITRGPAYLTAPEVGLMTLLETVLGPLWVWLALGEQPGRASLLSGVLIVAVLAGHSLLALRSDPG